jgi:hypothetical protein
MPNVVFVIREELERLLEEEKQAKRDEEIVRAIQVTHPVSPHSPTFITVYLFSIVH